MEFNATFLATIVTFIVFVLLMNKVLYAPVLGIMEERKAFIDGNYKAATDNEAKVAELTEEMNVQLAEAKDNAKTNYNESLAEYKEQRAEIVAEAQNTAKEEIENSRIELENISNEAKQSLKGSMTDLANDIVEKVIGYRSEVQGFDNQRVDEILYH